VKADELIAAVESAMTVLEPNYRGAATESDLYEACLLAILIGAAYDPGATVLMTSNGAQAASALRFRRSPGNLWLGNFTYGVISFPNNPKVLEAHLGVYVAGASGVHPGSRVLVASIEAKHYVASHGIGIGRGFLGLASELGQRKCCLGFPAKSSAGIAALISKKPSECFGELRPGRQQLVACGLTLIRKSASGFA
jgi:hypothetical protein